HVLGNLTFTWPGNRPKEPITPDNSVVSRMGSSVNRTNNVIVDTPTTTEVLETENRTTAAINPATGQPWFFTHVNLGLGNSDGTFESPFGTVAEALAATQGNGNDIVYVAQGTNPQIPAFTVPDNVQVRSQGPIQRIAVSPIASQLPTPSILNLGTVPLPASGSGQFPTVTGTVTMRNDTLLSGFAINPNGANGVEAVGVQNVVIDQNQITNAENGIRLQDLTGTVEVTNNVITQALDDGIVLDLDNTTLNTLLISGNTVSNVGEGGIDVDVYNNGQISSVTISNNTVSEVNASESSGIVLNVNTSSQVDTATISGNTVSVDELSTPGIFVLSADNSTLNTANITGNTVMMSREDTYGIYVLSTDNSAINTANITDNSVSLLDEDLTAIFAHVNNNSTITNATISDNIFTAVGNDDPQGITVDLDNSAISTVTVSGNTFTTAEDSADGINIRLDNSTITSTSVTRNTFTLTGSNSDGISFRLSNGSGINTASISDNNIATVDESIFVVLTDSTITTANITGNTVTTSGNDANGIGFNLNSNNSITTANISGNTVTTSGNDANGIFVYLDNNSSITTTNIFGNTVTTSGNDANGIFIDSYSSSITTANITGNTVTTSGNNAGGIRVATDYNNSTINTANITGNTITTSGTNADGIIVTPDASYDSRINTANISNNVILQAGRDSVRISNNDTNPICTSISDNRSDSPGFAMAGGTDFNLSSEGNTFQVVNLATVSADNNNAVFSFDGTLVPPGTPPAPFTNVASCP
uniref:beta strand repeat-containing protein n=1 Tax=Acaryochloris sp. IP29b_bin.137 TaxID=2969217 RepID=UPI002606ECCD